VEVEAYIPLFIEEDPEYAKLTKADTGFSFIVKNYGESDLSFFTDETDLLMKVDGEWTVIPKINAASQNENLERVPVDCFREFRLDFHDYQFESAEGHYASAVYCRDDNEKLIVALTDFLIDMNGSILTYEKWKDFSVINIDGFSIETGQSSYHYDTATVYIYISNMSDESITIGHDWRLIRQIGNEWYDIPVMPSVYIDPPPIEPFPYFINEQYMEAVDISKYTHELTDGKYAIYNVANYQGLYDSAFVCGFTIKP
jgi:archaellum component FlaG (FlaF/FlaG flagellin family)